MICGICGNSEYNVAFEVREMMFGLRDTFPYFQCSSCGCLQISEQPTDMSRYYPQHYYSLAKYPLAHFRNPFVSIVRRLRCRYAVLDRGLLGRFFYNRNPNTQLRSLSYARVSINSSILDVGSGTGITLYELRNAGFKNVRGLDPYIEHDISYPNGLNILKLSVHEMYGEWDIITMHHALEHMPDQLGALSSCARLMAEFGTLLVRVPTVSSYAWEHYGTNWIQLDAPRHFFLHSIRSMSVLASQAGLKLDRIVDDSFDLQFWGSEQYAQDIPTESERSYSKNPNGSIFTPDQIVSYRKQAGELNRQRRGDQVLFVLKKQIS